MKDDLNETQNALNSMIHSVSPSNDKQVIFKEISDQNKKSTVNYEYKKLINFDKNEINSMSDSIKNKLNSDKNFSIA